MVKNISVILCALMSGGIYAQGIEGRVVDEAGVAMPYTTIYAVDMQKGTASNADGFYQLDLPVGTYEIVYQFLGYKTIQRSIKVGTTMTSGDVVLSKEPTQLQTVEVLADQEDPAYTIMRKAIAKAKYHTQQLDEYRATSYIKGSGRLKKLPWLFRKQLEKEMRESGVDTATAFVTESVNEIHYQRPNQFSEKVISVRKVGNDNNTSPNGFINSSFYAPEVNGAISPLSPRAFTHYTFRYLGFKAEQGYNISKILVVPRRPGDQVFDGIIYIVDDLWCLHSVDLTTYIWGIRFDIDQIYQPFEPTVWLPINQTFDVAGSVFGFAFEYKYFAHIKNYDITLNPDLTFSPQVLDEKLAGADAKIADRRIREKSSLEETFSALDEGEMISRKRLRKVMKEYEEQQLEEFQKDSLVDVVSIYAQDVDSMAYERDSAYWIEIRPIPLTSYEVKGYKVMDSMSMAMDQEEDAREGSDTSIRKDRDFLSALTSTLLGENTHKIGEGWHFGYPSILADLHFNTVEGWHMTFKPFLSYRKDVDLKLQPEVHYGFSREVFNGGMTTSFGWGPHNRKSHFTVEGVSRVLQINSNRPIHPIVNDIYSLLLKRNYMKLLQKSTVSFSWRKDFSEGTQLGLTAQYFRKEPLVNNTQQVFFKNDRPYTSNTVSNTQNGSTLFSSYAGALVGFTFSTQPWQNYRMRNGQKVPVVGSSPTFDIQFTSAIDGLFHSELSHQQLELGFKQYIKMGPGENLQLSLNVGTFLNADDLPFPEYKHFPGNRTLINVADPVGSFRLLDYYNYSTSDAYLTLHSHYQFRKLLLTQMVLARLTGIKEHVFMSLLETISSNHYVEVGYGINYIFRFLKLEFVASFEDFSYQDFGVRIGIATDFESIFN